MVATLGRFQVLLVALPTFLGVLRAEAGVIEFTDKAEWQVAVGRFTTIDFTGFPEYTIITDQYEDLGVTFTDGNDQVFLSGGFENDGVGLAGGFPDDIELAFTTPQLAIAVHYPGNVQIELFNGGESIYLSTVFSDILGPFAGLVSDEPFDAAIITDPTDSAVFIDDLHFGVPAPPAFALLALAGLLASSRARRDRVLD